MTQIASPVVRKVSFALPKDDSFDWKTLWYVISDQGLQDRTMIGLKGTQDFAERRPCIGPRFPVVLYRIDDLHADVDGVSHRLTLIVQ